MKRPAMMNIATCAGKKRNACRPKITIPTVRHFVINGIASNEYSVEILKNFSYCQPGSQWLATNGPLVKVVGRAKKV